MVRTLQHLKACACLAAVVSLVALTPGVAQERPRIIGSTTAGLRLAGLGPEQALTVGPSLELAEIVERDVGLGRLTGMRAHDAGPFDSQRYGFSTVHVYFDRTLPLASDRSGLSSNATLRLIVSTRGEGGRVRWWRLEAPEESNSTYLPPLSVTDDPSDQERVASASSDPSLPVLEIRWATHAVGANSGVGLVRHLLLDLRGPVPRVLGLLDDVDGSIGGVCGSTNPTHTEIGCRWEGGDFLCAETLHRTDTRWAQRRGSRQFWLSSGEGIPLPRQSNYKTPVELVAQPIETHPVTFEGFGEARIISTTRIGNEYVGLVGSPSLSSTFGVEFFVAAIGRTPEGSGRVFAKLLRDDPEPAGQSRAELHRYTPDSLDLPRFDVRPIADDGTVTVLQVTATEGSGHGVYLIGIEPGERRLEADALRVATDAPARGDCNTARFPVTAVSLTARSTPFSATLDVEPANVEQVSQRGDLEIVRAEGEPACGSTTTVTWQRGRGFALSSTPKPCVEPATPRVITIDEHGTLAVKP